MMEQLPEWVTLFNHQWHVVSFLVGLFIGILLG